MLENIVCYGQLNRCRCHRKASCHGNFLSLAPHAACIKKRLRAKNIQQFRLGNVHSTCHTLATNCRPAERTKSSNSSSSSKQQTATAGAAGAAANSKQHKTVELFENTQQTSNKLWRNPFSQALFTRAKQELQWLLPVCCALWQHFRFVPAATACTRKLIQAAKMAH